MHAVLGLDIGGANLKAAHTDGWSHARPFPLWKSPHLLTQHLRELCAAAPHHACLAVTMTGELCDCFASKAEGVRAILASVEEVAATPVRVWTTAGRFVDLPAASAAPLPAAAANWLALAHLAGQRTGDGHSLLIDTGSTTTDIVFLDHGTPRPRGLTDRQRLACGELVYTALRRTGVCAVLGLEVAAEFFATMLDAYVLLGLTPESLDDTDTADGRPLTRAQARARLARLLCADAEELPMAEVESLARRAVDRQSAYVRQALQRVLHERPTPARVVLSGAGERLGQQVCAGDPCLSSLPLVSLSAQLGPGLSETACAYAVARLAGEEAR